MAQSIIVSSLLRTALVLDGVATGATGVLMTGGSGPLTGFLDIPRAVLLESGLVLLPVAVALLLMARRAELPRAWVWTVIVVNALWVIASVLALVAGWLAPKTFGLIFVTFQALAVAIFIELEYVGLRRSMPAVA